jgi:hypothetical protein
MSTQDPIVNRIRIIPRPDDFLDRNVGNSGELYYSKDANTLRVYSGRKRGGFEVVSEDNIRRNAARQGVATIKYTVTVTAGNHEEGDHGNVYVLNGEYKPRIDLIAGFTYYFDQSDQTNAYYPNAEGETFNVHPLFFSETQDGTPYELDVMYLLDNHPVTRSTYVSEFNTTTERAIQITVTTSTPETLFYGCTSHAGMGNEGSVSLPGGNNAAITVHELPPEDPENGNLWFNTNNGVLYVYASDADSSQWVQPSVPTNVDIQGGFNQVAVEGINLVLYTGQVLNFEATGGISLTPNVATKTITIGSDGLATTAYVDSAIDALDLGVDLTAFSVGAENLPSGNGAISYDNSTGVFTYTPPDTSSFISLGGLSVATGTATSGGSLSYNNVTGEFTFRPADLSGLGGGSSFDQDLNTTDSVTFNSVTTSTNFIAGGTGSPTLDSASTLTFDAPDGTRVTGGAFRVPTMTTTERDNLTPGNGDIIYNETDNKFQGYENGAWANLI